MDWWCPHATIHFLLVVVVIRFSAVRPPHGRAVIHVGVILTILRFRVDIAISRTWRMHCACAWRLPTHAVCVGAAGVTTTLVMACSGRGLEDRRWAVAAWVRRQRGATLTTHCRVVGLRGERWRRTRARLSHLVAKVGRNVHRVHVARVVRGLTVHGGNDRHAICWRHSHCSRIGRWCRHWRAVLREVLCFRARSSG